MIRLAKTPDLPYIVSLANKESLLSRHYPLS